MHMKQELVPEYTQHKRKIGLGIPPPFPNGWFKLLYSWEVDKGQVKYVEALGEHFAVFRGDIDGKSYILNAYCPHLGANIALGGVVKDNCVSCPFHAWKFDGETGKCVDIPYNSDAKIPNSAKTKKWISDEINGQILVWYHCDDLEPHYRQTEYPDIRKGNLKYHGLTEQYISCHTQEIAENGPDAAHLNVVHHHSVFINNPIIHHLWSARWEPGENERSYLTDIVVNESLVVFGIKLNFLDVQANINQVGPGLVNLSFNTPIGKILILQTVIPVRPMLTRVDHVCFADWKIPRFVGKIYLYNVGSQVEKDVIIWSNKTFNVNPLLCRGDGKITTFRQWYGQFYSKNSVTLQQYREKMMDW